MNTPTGGPWQARSEYEPWLIIGNVDGEIHADGTTSYTYKSICEICDDDGDARDNEANRRLIIAAPDLLAACIAVAKAKTDAENYARGGVMAQMLIDPKVLRAMADASFAKLNAAIRKATGQ